MDYQTLRFVVEKGIVKTAYYEGMLLHPTNPEHGMAVMRSNDNDLILDIYEIYLDDESTYHINQHLVNKKFETENDVQTFLNTFSTFKADDFTEFIATHETKLN